VNRSLKIPPGFRSPAQGCSNPGYRVAMNTQPQWGCAIIGRDRGHNPDGVKENRSCGPRVARASQPWALFRNPLGIEQKTIPTRFHPPAQDGNNPGYRNPVGVYENKSRGPRAAHTSQPWALFCNPFGIAIQRQGVMLPWVHKTRHIHVTIYTPICVNLTSLDELKLHA